MRAELLLLVYIQTPPSPPQEMDMIGVRWTWKTAPIIQGLLKTKVESRDTKVSDT